MSLDPGVFSLVQIFLVVRDLCVLLPEGLDHSDSIKCLFSIAGTLTVGFESLTKAALNSNTDHCCSYENHREGEKKDERHPPSSKEGDEQA